MAFVCARWGEGPREVNVGGQGQGCWVTRLPVGDDGVSPSLDGGAAVEERRLVEVHALAEDLAQALPQELNPVIEVVCRSAGGDPSRHRLDETEHTGVHESRGLHNEREEEAGLNTNRLECSFVLIHFGLVGSLGSCAGLLVCPVLVGVLGAGRGDDGDVQVVALTVELNHEVRLDEGVLGRVEGLGLKYRVRR